MTKFTANMTKLGCLMYKLTEAKWDIYVSPTEAIIGSDNGLCPGLHQAIIWTGAGTLLNGYLGTNLNEISIEIHKFSFKKIHFKI